MKTVNCWLWCSLFFCFCFSLPFRLEYRILIYSRKKREKYLSSFVVYPGFQSLQVGLPGVFDSAPSHVDFHVHLLKLSTHLSLSSSCYLVYFCFFFFLLLRYGCFRYSIILIWFVNKNRIEVFFYKLKGGYNNIYNVRQMLLRNKNANTINYVVILVGDNYFVTTYKKTGR